MPTPDEILDWTSDAIKTWLHSNPTPPSFNWLAMAEAASLSAVRGDMDVEKRDVLGDLAVHSFEMAVAQNASLRPGARLSEVVLRAGLIRGFGPSPGSVRDQNTLFDMIKRELESARCARGVVAERAADITTTAVADLRALRWVKNTLRAAESLLAERAQVLPESISWWWFRRDRLP